MKLHLIPVIFVLWVPIAACNSSNKPNDPTATQSASPNASPAVQTSPNSVPSNWYGYSASDGSYTIKFPAKPEERQQTANSAAGPINFALVIYSDNDKQRAYLASSNNVPLPPGSKADSFDVEKGLDGAREGAAKNAKATVISETKIDQNGYPGREITMRGQKNVAIRQRMFVDPKGPKLYQALVVAADGNIDFPDAQAFLDSLTIAK